MDGWSSARARCRFPPLAVVDHQTAQAHARQAQTNHRTHARSCSRRTRCPTLHSRHHSGRAVSRKSLRVPERGAVRPSRPPWSPSVAFPVCWRQVRCPFLCLVHLLSLHWLGSTSGHVNWVAVAMHPSSFAHWSFSTARDLTLEAARDASNVRRSSPKELPSGQLKKLLDSRTEREVLEGLRRVVTVGTTPPYLDMLHRACSAGSV